MRASTPGADASRGEEPPPESPLAGPSGGLTGSSIAVVCWRLSARPAGGAGGARPSGCAAPGPRSLTTCLTGCLPTLGSLEFRQHLFDRAQEMRAAAGLAPRPEEERPSEAAGTEQGESLICRYPPSLTRLRWPALLLPGAAGLSLGRCSSCAPARHGPADRAATAAVRRPRRWPGCSPTCCPSGPCLPCAARSVAGTSSPPHNHRYMIEVGSGLVPPEEVARFYRLQRDKDAWSGLPETDWNRRPRSFHRGVDCLRARDAPGVPASAHSATGRGCTGSGKSATRRSLIAPGGRCVPPTCG